MAAQDSRHSRPANEGSRMSGIELIAEARAKHEAKGWTAEHDDSHVHGELRRAAAEYALRAGTDSTTVPDMWPWEPSAWKPSGSSVRDLIKAGALIAAEIDRIGRKLAKYDAGALDRLIDNALRRHAG